MELREETWLSLGENRNVNNSNCKIQKRNLNCNWLQFLCCIKVQEAERSGQNCQFTINNSRRQTVHDLVVNKEYISFLEKENK